MSKVYLKVGDVVKDCKVIIRIKHIDQNMCIFSGDILEQSKHTKYDNHTTFNLNYTKWKLIKGYDTKLYKVLNG